jgi:threonine dehydratase
MISGTCLTLSTIAPGVEIYAAEPEQADDAARSFRAGHVIADDARNTVADGLKVPLKELTWYFVSNHVTDILTASEQEIVDAMRLKNPETFAGRRVGVIVTGGNVDLNKLPCM